MTSTVAQRMTSRSPSWLVIPVLSVALLVMFATPVVAIAVVGVSTVALAAVSRHPDYDPSTFEKRFFFAAGFFVFVWLLADAIHGRFAGHAYVGYVALALVYPAHRLCRRWQLDERILWWSMASVAVVGAAATVLWLVCNGPPAETNVIPWGYVAFVAGALTLGGVDYAVGRTVRAGMLTAAILGLMAGLASGGWAPWLALPFVVAGWFFLSRPRLSFVFRMWAVLVICIGLEVLLAVHGTGVANRFHRLGLQVAVWWHSGATEGVLGAVQREWLMALASFASHPVIGMASAPVPATDLNQYLLTLRDTGLFGLVALGLLLGVPTAASLWAVRHDNHTVQRLGRAGLLLVVAYGVMGLIDPLFANSRTLFFFVLAEVALYAIARESHNRAWAGPVARRLSLSVTVITKNEADRIGRCLDSVANWADEIIVLDSGSSDNTVEIARRYTDHVEETDWPGFGKQKQRALEWATGDWVLSLDADEALTPALRHEIDTVLATERPSCVCYGIPWAVMAYGGRLDFGRHARAPLRLVQRDGARFSDAIVHEKIMPPPGETGELECRLVHYSVRDFGHALQKLTDYALLGARLRHQRGRHGGGLIGATIRSVWVFFFVYLVRLGFLDGAAGFVDAVLNAQYTFNKYAGLWELRRIDAQRPHDYK